MPETIANKNVFSLLEVSRSIQKTINDRYGSDFWVKAEMVKLNFYTHSGHCYPDLVEKQEGKIIAQIRSNLWHDDYMAINNNFLSVLKEPLKDGIKILFRARINYDPVYGLSLRILDIDPSYTMGDMEKEKQEAIKKLQQEGIFGKNKTLRLPLLPQRIAIISVETSKGYADFRKVIDSNSWKYKFFYLLFPSLLQGDKAVEAMVGQLNRIRKVISHFDVVGIIRGGGGDTGLSCYNNYLLAKEIALFPIPVITGIGHATNETVAEMVSFTNAITPTKLAEYLIQHFHNYSVPVQKAEEKLIDRSMRIISEEKNNFHAAAKLFRSLTKNLLLENKSDIEELTNSLIQHSKFILRNENAQMLTLRKKINRASISFIMSTQQQIRQLAISMKKDSGAMLGKFEMLITHNAVKLLTGLLVSFRSGKENISMVNAKLSEKCGILIKAKSLEMLNIEKNINNLDPKNVLKRGYSITLLDGKAITAIGQVNEGNTLKTLVYDGQIISNVKSIKKT